MPYKSRGSAGRRNHAKRPDDLQIATNMKIKRLLVVGILGSFVAAGGFLYLTPKGQALVAAAQERVGAAKGYYEQGVLLKNLFRKFTAPVADILFGPYWIVEDKSEREKLPLYKFIKAAQPEELTAAAGSPDAAQFKTWHRSHGDMGSSRYSSLDQISTGNVKALQIAWVYRPGDGASGIQSNPVIANGVMYTPTPGHHIVAVDATTGKEKWRFKSPSPFPAKRGLVWWPGTETIKPRLYFPAGNKLFALDAETGKLAAGFGTNGHVERHFAKIAPTISGDTILWGTFKPSVEAVDVLTGTNRWSFDLIEDKFFRYVGGKRYERTGSNPWAGMSVDEKRGIAFVSTGNPNRATFVGVFRPGRNAMSNSVVALDIKSGKKLWDFQETRHDVWDLDVASPPTLTSIERNGRKVDVVAVPTKSGNVLLLDRASGKPIFDFRLKRAPTSNLVGEKTAPYQPNPTLPEPFTRQFFRLDEVTDIGDANRRSVLGQLEGAKFGFFETPEVGKDLILFGLAGGAQWPGASVDQKSGVMYVAANEFPFVIRYQVQNIVDESKLPKSAGREVYLQACASCHGLNREGGDGPQLYQVTERRSQTWIRTAIAGGFREMPPIEGLSAQAVDQITDYLAERDNSHATATGGRKKLVPPDHVPRGLFDYFRDHEGYPGSKPPWGTLNALDLNSGKLLWKVPLGEHKELTARGTPLTGTANRAGPVVTAGGLVFVSGTLDKKIRAFDKQTGEELWSHELPFVGSAPPATYEVDGTQYIVIPATGSRTLQAYDDTIELGDAFIAFKLSETK